MNILNDVSIIFLSIFLEAAPFLLLGAILSALIERFVSADTMAKIIPKNMFFGALFGVILGFFLPACDCAVIPVSRRLIKKEVPLNVAVSFMLASPIINPVVLLSTYQAFYVTNPNIFWYRLFGGIFVALIVGILISIIFQYSVLKDQKEQKTCGCGHNHDHSHCHHEHKKENKLFNNINFILKHTADDFYDVVKFLMFGALITSLVSVLLPTEVILSMTNSPYVTLLILMIFAYLLSLCSTSDSFIGKSLLPMFGEMPIMGYLLLGPMIDIKNTFVLLGNYKKGFVYTLIGLIFLVVYLVSAVIYI